MTSLAGPVFADTSYWIAFLNGNDEYHCRAMEWAAQITGRLFTTEAVILETANSMSKPNRRQKVIDLVERLKMDADVSIVELTREVWDDGWNLYSARPDKSWSLVDAISFCVMSRRGIEAALSTDEHYRQAGFVPLLLQKP